MSGQSLVVGKTEGHITRKNLVHFLKKSQENLTNHREITKITEKERKITQKSHNNQQNHQEITVIFEITKISYTFL